MRALEGSHRPCGLPHGVLPFQRASGSRLAAPACRCSSSDRPECSVKLSRREVQNAAVLTVLLGAAAALRPPSASALACPGMRGRELQQCLKKARQERESAESQAPTEGEKAKYEYANIGELFTLPSGIQYREIETGTGREADVGATCAISYSVFRLSSGGYFKNSSGGTPVYLWGLGDGLEFQGDPNATYSFRLGDRGALPRAAALAVKGMREGGRRRVLVPPQGGFVSDSVGPIPQSFGAKRRLAAHRDEPLLFEAKLLRVRPAAADSEGKLEGEDASGQPFRLPAPPSPYRDKLG